MNTTTDLRPAWSRTWTVCWKDGSGWALYPLTDVTTLNALLVARGDVGYQVVAICDGLGEAQRQALEWKRRMRT
jgi:hypothetical protein